MLTPAQRARLIASLWTRSNLAEGDANRLSWREAEGWAVSDDGDTRYGLRREPGDAEGGAAYAIQVRRAGTLIVNESFPASHVLARDTTEVTSALIHLAGAGRRAAAAGALARVIGEQLAWSVDGVASSGSLSRAQRVALLRTLRERTLRPAGDGGRLVWNPDQGWLMSGRPEFCFGIYAEPGGGEWGPSYTVRIWQDGQRVVEDTVPVALVGPSARVGRLAKALVRAARLPEVQRAERVVEASLGR